MRGHKLSPYIFIGFSHGKLRQKWTGQQFRHRQFYDRAGVPAVGHPHHRCGRIFNQKLTAGPARHRTCFHCGHNGQRRELSLPFAQGLKQRHSLGAAGQAKAHALHINA